MRNSLQQLKPYDGEDTIWPVKLDANEMPDQAAIFTNSAIADALAQIALNRYPPIAAMDLRRQLADSLGLTAGEVLVGNGSSELLGAICYAFGGAGRKIVYPTPSFSMYGVYASLADSEAVTVGLDENFALTPEKIVSQARAVNASLVILCNPNNPTGTVLPQDAIEYIVANSDCPVVVDEAYYEFYGQSSLPLLSKYNNLIITRTFSKAYGLAAARIGYLMTGAELAGIIGKALLPYHVNALSLTLAAAVFERREQVKANVRQIIAEREWLNRELNGLGGMTVYPSRTNFLLLRSAQAGTLAKELAGKGIGIRDFSGYPGLTDCLRITIGDKKENGQLVETICRFLKKG